MAFDLMTFQILKQYLHYMQSSELAIEYIFQKNLKHFCLQPSLTMPFKVWDNEEKFLYREIDIKSIFLISQLTLAMKI